MTPLHHQTTIFELLPPDIVGYILHQLNQVTGSEGIINQADIPVVMRYARSLVCTSKRMAANINHSHVTHIFLKSLSEKYEGSSEHFAALLDTIGARVQLWNYIKENGDDKTYQVIQEIYELASDVLKEAKSAGLGFEYSEGRRECPMPSPLYSQTKQGFVLYNDGAPSHLATPFGHIIIYGGGISSKNAPLSIAEVFIRRLNAVFECVAWMGDLDRRGQGQFFEIAAPSGSDTIRKISNKEKKQISEEELESRKGTQNLILNSLCGNYGSYKIREVKGKKVPDVIWHDPEKARRSCTLIQGIWEMLRVNRLGQDPIAKKINCEEVVAKSKDVKILFNNSSEISQWGIEQVAKLEQQPPIFSNKKWMRHIRKVLLLEHYNDPYVIEVLNGTANRFLYKGSEWPIHAFNSFNDHQSLNREDLGSGIALWVCEKTTLCDLSTLKSAYDSVIESIGQNWVESKLKDYPGILSTQSEEDYVLFIKKKSFYEEDVLIRGLVKLLGLSRYFSSATMSGKTGTSRAPICGSKKIIWKGR